MFGACLSIPIVSCSLILRSGTSFGLVNLVRAISTISIVSRSPALRSTAIRYISRMNSIMHRYNSIRNTSIEIDLD